MLRILGSHKRLCDGLSRRDFLQAGGLGLLGLGSSLGGLSTAAAAEATGDKSFGQAKRCILLYLYGAASQLETFDPKPLAPAEVRGELGAIATSVPGVQIGELLPQTARIIDRATIVRSMTHPYPLHASAFTLTSIPTIDVPLQMSPRDPRHWPFIGSVVDYLADQRGGPPAPIARNVGLPWRLSARRPYAAGDNAGPYGAWLGRAYDPLWTDFHGTGTRDLDLHLRQPDDPLPGSLRAAGARLPLWPGGRRSTARGPDARPAQSPPLAAGAVRRCSAKARCQHGRRASFDDFRRQAFSYLTTSTLADALDVAREPAALRERYGMTLFGQASLVARRLLEAGTQFVTVLWDEFELVNSAWDTHYYHYELMREQLCPGLDRALATLVLDLEARGMLDDTLIVCTTEHGRTPKLENVAGGGRGHWAQAYSHAAGRRRGRPRQSRGPHRQDRRQRARHARLAQRHPGHDVPPAGHRPANANPRSARPAGGHRRRRAKCGGS